MTLAPSAAPSKPTLALPPELAEEYQRAIQAMVTEDDEPVDNLFSEKQQRLLVESLYAGWVASSLRQTAWRHRRGGIEP